jgi:hypothetical protein
VCSRDLTGGDATSPLKVSDTRIGAGAVGSAGGLASALDRHRRRNLVREELDEALVQAERVLTQPKATKAEAYDALARLTVAVVAWCRLEPV